MCLAASLDKLRLKNPLARKIEQETGLRPHGSAFMLGGKRKTNLYYQPGGRGYTEQSRPGYSGPPAHSLGIKKRNQ